MGQELGGNQDVARLRSPTKDKRMGQELGGNQDVARLRSPTEDKRMGQDYLRDNTFLRDLHDEHFVKTVFLAILSHIYLSEEYFLSAIHPQRG